MASPDVTLEEKLKELQRVAEAALACYDLPARASATMINLSENATYRIDAGAQSAFPESSRDARVLVPGLRRSSTDGRPVVCGRAVAPAAPASRRRGAVGLRMRAAPDADRE